MTSRQEISARRQVAVMGPSFGLLLFLMVKLMIPDGEFHNQVVDNQPNFVKGLTFLNPWLDLALCCFYVWLMARLLFVGFAARKPADWPHSPKDWLQVTAMIFAVAGTFGGSVFAAVGGWFVSIQAFLYMGVCFTVCAAALGAFMVMLLWLGNRVPPLAQFLWARVRHLPVAQSLTRFMDHLAAKDIPEDTDK